MDYGLYQEKYKYERLIRNLDETLVKLESCYSNLILCKKKITNNLKINDNYYNYKEFEKIIGSIDNNIRIIKNVVLPQARYEYNNILLQISKL